MTRVRAFIALNLPVDVVTKAAEVQSKLVEAAAAAQLKVKWVPAPNMHVTLKFLGEIPRESIEAIERSLRDNLAGRPALNLRVGGAGAFPSADRPRVLWLGIESGDDGVTKLASDVEGWLDDLGFPKDKHDFHPHLTLGRVKQGQADILEGFEADVGQCTAHEVVLYESVLQRKGAEYKPLVRIPLGSTTPE